MITSERVIQHFKRQFPKLVVTRVIDYDTIHYVVEAVRDLKVPDYNCPYYGVDKRTGEITSFIPTFDLDEFFNALETRTIYSTGKGNGDRYA